MWITMEDVWSDKRVVKGTDSVYHTNVDSPLYAADCKAGAGYDTEADCDGS